MPNSPVSSTLSTGTSLDRNAIDFKTLFNRKFLKWINMLVRQFRRHTKGNNTAVVSTIMVKSIRYTTSLSAGHTSKTRPGEFMTGIQFHVGSILNSQRF